MLPKKALIALFWATTQAALDLDLATVGVWPELDNSTIPLRQNINTLSSEAGPQWDLYIQALNQMYNARDSDPFSFFQIAGIHGIPFAEWGQTGGRNGATGWAGYCPHGEDIFLPWHRPYVALYEQVMVKKAREIAETYPDNVRDQYRRAADSLRSPFWDWATDNRVPVATTTEKVTIKGVQDGQVREMSVNNPLWTYVFPKDFADGKYEQKPRDGERVLRCTAPFSYPATANANIQRQGYRQQLYDLFTRTTDFASFGSVSRKGTSLEMLHNHIHWDAGCDHTFVQPSTSGFDPLFWLHHTNVDRLWAYWTAIKPEQKTMNYEYVGKARFSTPENSTITIDSPLQPFFNEHGEWHTTASVSELDSFGYSYEGLEYWRKSPEEMQRDATSLINNLYGPRGRNGKRADGGPPKTRLFASVTVDASQLATRPCAVEVSISGYKSGSIIVLPHPEKGEVYGGFSLDEAMASRGLAMASISKKVSALQQQIEVNIVKPNGERVPATNITSLRVDIEEIDITPPTQQTEMPKISLPRIHKAWGRGSAIGRREARHH